MKGKQQTFINRFLGEWRFYTVIGLFSTMVLLVVFRLLDLQILHHKYGSGELQSRAERFTLKTEEIIPQRGMITDRHGEPLAVSASMFSIWAEPVRMKVVAEELAQLAKILEIPSDELVNRLQKNKTKGFIWLQRHVPPQLSDAVLALNMEGVHVKREYRRFYPAGEATAHLVGFTDIDGQGIEGLELAYDRWLSGRAGQKQVLKDRKNRVIREVRQIKQARSGKSLTLSVDLRLQSLLHNLLRTAVVRHAAQGGSIVVLEVQSGEVLAVVNQPSYNPNNRQQIKLDQVRNRAFVDIFEPGSTMKPFTLSAALADGIYTPSSLIDTRPGKLVDEDQILAEDPRDLGVMTLARVLARSSQVGTGKIALDIGADKIYQLLKDFGFGKPLGLNFPGEARGILSKPKHWTPLTTVTMSFGYGMAVSAMQLAYAYSIFANNGVSPQVTLLAKPIGQKSSNKQQVIEPDIATQIMGMLGQVAAYGGTGWRAKVSGYEVGGKTGTVHKVSKIGYEEDRYLSLFCGVAPLDKPQLVVVVVIDDPQSGGYFGSEIAAPIFSQAMLKALRLRNILPQGSLTYKQATDKNYGG